MFTVKKDQIILGAFLGGLLILIFFGLEKKWSFPDQCWPLEKGEVVKINSEIIQKFKASQEGLARIKILFRGSDIKPGGKFNLKIYEETCQNIIREANLDVTSLDSDNTNDFVFSRIKDSENQIFCLKLNYAPKKGGKKANIFIINNSMPENIVLLVDGQENPGKSISFRPSYKNDSFWQNCRELNQRISQYKPWFLKHYFLYSIVFGLILLSIAIVVILILI